MENITSKDLCYLITSTLRLIDKGPMDHGLRVAYFLLKMLECRGGYVEYELAENILLAMIHDIGAYKTEDLSKKLNYERNFQCWCFCYLFFDCKFVACID